jgi:hypothetical protein
MDRQGAGIMMVKCASGRRLVSSRLAVATSLLCQPPRPLVSRPLVSWAPIAHWCPLSPAKALNDNRRSAHVHPEYLLTIKLLPDTCICAQSDSRCCVFQVHALTMLSERRHETAI